MPAEDVAEWSGEGSNTQGEREGGRGSKHRKTRARKKPRIDLTAMDKNNRGPRHANQFGGKNTKRGSVSNTSSLSLAVSLPLLCWTSILLSPPPLTALSLSVSRCDANAAALEAGA